MAQRSRRHRQYSENQSVVVGFWYFFLKGFLDREENLTHSTAAPSHMESIVRYCIYCNTLKIDSIHFIILCVIASFVIGFIVLYITLYFIIPHWTVIIQAPPYNDILLSFTP